MIQRILILLVVVAFLSACAAPVTATFQPPPLDVAPTIDLALQPSAVSGTTPTITPSGDQPATATLSADQITQTLQVTLPVTTSPEPSASPVPKIVGILDPTRDTTLPGTVKAARPGDIILPPQVNCADYIAQMTPWKINLHVVVLEAMSPTGTALTCISEIQVIESQNGGALSPMIIIASNAIEALAQVSAQNNLVGHIDFHQPGSPTDLNQLLVNALK